MSWRYRDGKCVLVFERNVSLHINGRKCIYLGCVFIHMLNKWDTLSFAIKHQQIQLLAYTDQQFETNTHTWESLSHTTSKLLHPLQNKTQHKVVTQRSTNEEVSTKHKSEGVSICPVSVRHLVRQLSRPSRLGLSYTALECSCVCMHFTVQRVCVCSPVSRTIPYKWRWGRIAGELHEQIWVLPPGCVQQSP